ncbi:helix-turn-helix domain-containing protein [Megasphaera elsdenii]|uniref:Helix-turn-helix domain-containing protein n=1 Tax=Megasphaera elsdenii DSM 20460 TaxID=1064535 RepID=G0VSD9_MEGEL|nr:helix-turn-helix domain-containing protein [Megasphaera elsdenii]AVO75130.1 hypothetical protein C6362_09395 [Megasphaera elsdenii DSM 20460]CCC74179.1 hypothetical protein MELS_1961 [Megasphaera elsdenii DSM 20460]
MSRINVYQRNKWVNLWVSYMGGKRFSWLVSAKATTDEFECDYSMLNKLCRSGLSSTAKGIFSFILLNRYLPTKVCLYGQTTIAKMYGCANNTARRALNELEDNKIIYSLKIHTGRYIAYQYVINEYKEWNLPENSKGIHEEKI